jgi:hypothetical protein
MAWRTHSCVQRSQSCERDMFPAPQGGFRKQSQLSGMLPAVAPIEDGPKGRRVGERSFGAAESHSHSTSEL